MSPAASLERTEEQARGYLTEGKLCLAAGRRERAKMWLREVLELFPSTSAATEAKRLMQPPR